VVTPAASRLTLSFFGTSRLQFSISTWLGPLPGALKVRADYLGD
jgi:hypothetical protein